MADRFFLQQAEECRQAAGRAADALTARCFLAAAENFEAQAAVAREYQRRQREADEHALFDPWDLAQGRH